MQFSSEALSLFGVSFARPLLLLALLLLPALLVLRARWWWLRAVALAAVVVALAQPWSGTVGGHLAVIVDVSDSVGERALTAASGLDLGALGANADFMLVAAETLRVEALPAETPAGISTGATDLATALQVATVNGASRVLLFSDGVTDETRLLTSLPPVPIDVWPLEGVSDVRMQELHLPTEAAPGQLVEAVAVIRADREAPALLHLEVGGESLPPVAFTTRDGDVGVEFTFPAAERGATPVVATVTVGFDQPTGNDVARGEVTIKSELPLLVIGDPALAALLSVQGFEVVVGSPQDIVAPLPFSAVVLRGSAAQFTSGQLGVLRAFVESGGGLMMTGGPDSFGFGAWYRTAVEEVLPVTTDLRTEVALPLVAMVLVIDVSQSMASGRPSRLDLAKQGALQVIELAYEEDLLGLVAFSDGPGTRWIFQPRKATERGKREMAQGVLSLSPGGGTVLEPAYRMALEALDGTEAALKHVVVLSDGQLYDGISPFGEGQGSPVDFPRIADAALARGITTSTIAIGESADFQRLSEIAAAGGGRYYAAMDASTLPKVFADEALLATRALLVEERTVPTARPNPFYSFPADLPPVDAYVATSLKVGAQELLEGRVGEPILATMRVGLGRTAALTTDLNAWVGELGAWPELPGALATIARWLRSSPPGWSATAERTTEGVIVTLDAVDGGAYVNNARVEARLGGQITQLQQVGPGRYEGSLPYSGEVSQVVLASEGEVVARARVRGPDPEFAEVDGKALLQRVAEQSGGLVVAAGEPYAPTLVGDERWLWRYFALAGAALFMLELILRRRFG